MQVKECQVCRKDFTTRNKKAKYCSIQCRDVGRTSKVGMLCRVCGKGFWVHRCRAGDAQFCSGACRNRSIFTRDVRERFWEKVDKRGDDECWEWQGFRERRGGYGQIRINRKCVKASRYSYELHNGPIPKGLFVCHSCDNPPCVNPRHLWLGTSRDNIRDSIKKGRLNPQKNAATKLDKESVLIIKEMIVNKIAGNDIAGIFGVSPATISDIKYGRRWANV